MDAFYYFIDFVLSIVIVAVVNLFGSKGLPRSYAQFLAFEDSNNSLFNIGYRIFSPIVILVMIVLVASATSESFDAQQTFLTICFYWLIRFVFWLINIGKQRANMLMFFAQAIFSIAVCFYIYRIAMDDPLFNMLPQSSDISFEIAILIIFVVLQALAQSSLFKKEDSYWKTKADSEKMLFEFERNYYGLLPLRFKQDVALRILLYTFALTENHYRPARIRRIERLAARMGMRKFGIARTTGLMQVKSEKVLSDEESVLQALPILERIYDEYISKSNCLMVQLVDTYLNSNVNPAFLFAATHYSYDLHSMVSFLEKDIGALYGKYSGSNLVKPVRFFNFARDFIYAKEYENGTRRVEVDCAIKTRFSDLPTGAWVRVGKEQGFVVMEDCDHVTVMSTQSAIDIISILDELRSLNADKTMVLFCSTFNRTILMFVESGISPQLEKCFIQKGFVVRKNARWRFMPFAVNPLSYISQIENEDILGYGLG